MNFIYQYSLTVKLVFVVSTEGGMDIEEVAKDTPELIHTFGIDSNQGCSDENLEMLQQKIEVRGNCRNSK